MTASSSLPPPSPSSLSPPPLLPTTDAAGGSGLYVHWPYCTRICPYCDFNVARARNTDHAAWRRAFIAELDHWAGRTGDRPLTSIYFGGGTPSLMPPAMIESLINHCDRRWPGVRSAEITLEVNPTRHEAQHIPDFCAAGVNRLSVGIQSFDPRQLSFLGRNNSIADGDYAIDMARKHAASFSIDLIYGLPDQTEAGLDRELDQAFATGAPHLSFYQLTIEPGTAFHRAVARNRFTPIADDHEARLYDRIALRTRAAGRPPYEVSNHARPGHESRHNQLYWQYRPCLGVGPGAHGRVMADGSTRHIYATYAEKSVEKWLGLTPERRTEVTELSQDEIANEILLMGLRLAVGVELARLELLSGRTLDGKASHTLVEEGLARRTATHFILTDRGRKLLTYCAGKLAF